MKGFPSVELLNSTHSFPTVYTFKIIGAAGDGFLVRVLQETRVALGIEKDPKYLLRQTSGGAHIAITIEADVQSAEQVLDVYHGLQAVEGIILLM